MSRRFRLEERELFERDVAAIATTEGVSIQDVHTALTGVYVVLWSDPTQYPEVIMSGISELRCAKTEYYIGDGYQLPPFRLFYRIVDDHTVALLKLETRREFGF